jgi:hypothetical protein
MISRTAFYCDEEEIVCCDIVKSLTQRSQRNRKERQAQMGSNHQRLVKHNPRFVFISSSVANISLRSSRFLCDLCVKAFNYAQMLKGLELQTRFTVGLP